MEAYPNFQCFALGRAALRRYALTPPFYFFIFSKSAGCQSPGMAKITGFHHTAIRSADFDASVRFYTEVLGLKTKISWGETPSRATMLDAGDGRYLEIFERAEPAPQIEATILHFALRTDDCAAILEEARSAGAEVTMETKDLTIDSSAGPIPVRIAFFKGPDGEVIELFENAVL